jgi:Pyridoxamine 5'-phosphate oxidase
MDSQERIGAQMPSRKSKKAVWTPKAERPEIPGYGLPKSKKGLLPWKWAQAHLRSSRQYWIATTKPDQSPHLMVVWGLWIDDCFFFSTGKKSRKGRNLAKNPRCVIGSEDAAQAVIVEGVVKPFDDAEELKPIFSAYKKKYNFDVSGMGEPFYRLTPRVAFGLIEKKFATTATRWKFS